MRHILLMVLICSMLSCRADEKLADVGGKTISGESFEAYLKYKRINTQDEQRRQALLKKFVQRESLAAAIEKSGRLDQDVIQAELNEIRKEILISRYFERFVKEQLSDDVLRKYYESHADDYAEDQAHVAHILIRTHPMMTEDQRKAMLERIQRIRGQIKAGKSFDELAKANSQDKATAHKGGDLGWLKKGAMGQVFSDAAFRLEAGEVSEPVQTSFGYHLIKVLEAPRVINRPFESVAASIRNKLKLEVKSKEIERLLASMETEIK